ncbi:PPC domain-containing protein, partial [Singulisphaera rosea]
RKDADPELTFSPPADGTYRVLVRDLNDEGGDDFVYRLDLTAPSPDFHLSLAEDRFTLEPGKSLSLRVNIQRRDGFNRPIEVRLEGFPAGVEATSVRSEPTGDSSRKVSLTLTSKGASPASAPIRVIAKAVDGPSLERPAQLSADDADRMPTHAWLTVAKPVAGK